MSIAEVIDLAAGIIVCDNPIVHDTERLRPDNSEVLLLQANSNRLTAATGWRPRTDFHDGLARTVSWWRRRLASGRVRAGKNFMTRRETSYTSIRVTHSHSSWGGYRTITQNGAGGTGMCGIVGVIATRPAAPLLLESLRRISGLRQRGCCRHRKCPHRTSQRRGRRENPASALERWPLSDATGIGHTRWDVPGPLNQPNVHPLVVSRVSVVHQGTIENDIELRAEPDSEGLELITDTEAELVVPFVNLYMNRGRGPISAAGRHDPQTARCICSFDDFCGLCRTCYGRLPWVFVGCGY
jgi:hypothetical protein